MTSDSRFAAGRLARRILPWTATAASAALLWCAFPPVSEAATAWAAFVPLLLLAAWTTPREAFRWGFRSGLLFWMASLSWLLRLWETGDAPAVALVGVVAGWVGLSAYCALYTGAFLFVAAGALRGVGDAGPVRRVGLALIIPLLWVGFEYLRSILFTGFPWNALGVSQYRNLAVIQVAEWGGVYAVSAVVMCLNAAFALTTRRVLRGGGRGGFGTRFNWELMAGLLVAVLCWTHGLRAVARERTARNGRALVKVAAVQPAVEQGRKWTENSAEEIHERLLSLTETALAGPRPDLLVWPETSVPGCAASDDASGELVRAIASGGGVPLLVGSMEAEDRGGEELLYNSSFLFEGEGGPKAVYRKRHLVPFGEYVPLDRAIPLLRRMAPLGFSCTPGTTSTVFRLSSLGVGFSALICFEDTVAGLARASVRGGAGFLVNQTNDAWFDRTAAPVQHMSHCVFRCVENRVDAVRSANTGVTCFIGSDGAVDLIGGDDAACGVQAGKTGGVRVRAAGAPPTYYTRYGDWPFAVPCALLALGSLAWALRRRATGTATPA